MTNDNEIMTNDNLMKLCQVFCDKKIKVHIRLKTNWFYNGTIKEVYSDYIIFLDDQEGEFPVFYVQMHKAPEKYVVRGGA